MDHPPTRDWVVQRLVRYWSPEQISGRLGIEQPPGLRDPSRQSIERWIRQDKDRTYWETFLRRRGKRRPKQDRRGHLPGVVTIRGRPEAASQRSRTA